MKYIKITLLIITAAASNTIAATAQDLTSLLQKGLAEEEINRDPAAAIKQYVILLKEFNKGRQLAATALFRTSECCRKLGDDKAAAKNLQQLIALYPKQDKLVALARQNLTALGFTPALPVADGLKMNAEGKGILFVNEIGERKVDGFTVKAWSEKKGTPPKEGIGAMWAMAPGDPGCTYYTVQGSASPVFHLLNSTHSSKTPWFLWIENKKTVWHFDGVILGLTIHHADVVSHKSIGVKDELVKIDRFPPPFIIQRLPNDLQEKIRRAQQAGKSLIHAVLVGDVKAVKQALKDGAHPDTTFKGRVNPMTCLEQAAKMGDLRMIDHLLDHGADANKRVAEYTPLHSASYYGKVEAIKLLLERGADPKLEHPKREAFWRSVLDISLLNRQLEATQFWVKRGVCLTDQSWQIAKSMAEFDKANRTTKGKEVLDWLEAKFPKLIK